VNDKDTVILFSQIVEHYFVVCVYIQTGKVVQLQCGATVVTLLLLVVIHAVNL